MERKFYKKLFVSSAAVSVALTVASMAETSAEGKKATEGSQEARHAQHRNQLRDLVSQLDTDSVKHFLAHPNRSELPFPNYLGNDLFTDWLDAFAKWSDVSQ